LPIVIEIHNQLHNYLTMLTSKFKPPYMRDTAHAFFTLIGH